ncbi:hypothetical protein HCN44_006025 [Aphidius gifuensis]|uniref:Glycerol kinase 5 n=1 Tax=Aphidius gifuensis TaxID=684658 RepID=A0A835CUX5_APHGI|nr:putative glycerol kinase 5 [Aphidius gifuensis]KAF7997454.1 hypothetical protein HCN44_006025 [Aphidius gifuensis]
MKYIVALDVGTTTVKCHVLNDKAVSVGSAVKKVELLYPKPGYVEIDQDDLWDSIVTVLKEAVNASNIDVKSIACLGISTQRNSCLSWNIETGKYYHKIITWKDLRADSMVKKWNSSLVLKSLRTLSYFLYTISRRKKFLAGSMFKLMNSQMTLRFNWALQNIPGLKEDGLNGKAVFGGIDCWILYKLTGKHITDYSCASASGLFDPFSMSWAPWAINLFKIPWMMMPKVVDTAGDFGCTPEDIFGISVPIMCSMADQSASLFGSGCFQRGDLKVTLGTGTFLDVNTGKEAHASISGLYPLVGWKIDSELVYMAEGLSNDTGTLVEWAKALEMINDPSEMSLLSNSVKNSDGVYFVPAFSGLQAPINDHTAATGFLGVKPTTRKAHMIRSISESIVFRILLLYNALQKETRQKYFSIRVDGGVSKDDFVLQLLADLTGLPVERPSNTEMSIFGVAFLSGLQCGIWKNRDELINLRNVDTVFKPNKNRMLEYQSTINQWNRAVDRFQNWY